MPYLLYSFKAAEFQIGNHHGLDMLSDLGGLGIWCVSCCKDHFTYFTLANSYLPNLESEIQGSLFQVRKHGLSK